MTVHSFYLITTTVISHYSQFYLITIAVISPCSQFFSHHNYSYKLLFTVYTLTHLKFKSLFTVGTSSELQLLFTVLTSSQPKLSVNINSFHLIITTFTSLFSQFFSHHNLSYKSLFTVCTSSQL